MAGGIDRLKAPVDCSPVTNFFLRQHLRLGRPAVVSGFARDIAKTVPGLIRTSLGGTFHGWRTNAPRGDVRLFPTTGPERAAVLSNLHFWTLKRSVYLWPSSSFGRRGE